MADPQSAYRQLLASGAIEADVAQAAIVEQLQGLHNRLINSKPLSSFFSRKKRYPLLTGIYLHGGVGRGKTWLMDLFFQSLPFAEKQRDHFHHFMRDMHARLKQHQGRRDPLRYIAAEMAPSCRVLCLDEFHVTDIGDAMIVAQLLRGLFEQGITLVTTSNTEPERLYNEGIQRASFLPAIDLLEQYTQVLALGGERDYRLSYLEQAPVYLTGDAEANRQQLDEEFTRLAPAQTTQDADLEIAGRPVRYHKKSADVIWFNFSELCQGPRNSADFIEIARYHHTVLLEAVPVLDGSRDDCARRFISMIDVFYDRSVKLVISADAPAPRLYQGERLAFEFQRTASRLQEMQSSSYLALPHKPE
ncbi:MAG: cell division protein ZapE [Chromatiales bacterium]